MEQVNADDENDKMEYEARKVRELKRLKREKGERHQKDEVAHVQKVLHGWIRESR
jgi:hypothetical protein